MLQAPLYFVVQQYQGDTLNNLRGDVSVYATRDAANTANSQGVNAANNSELCRLSINTTSVAGQDPFITITNALIAKFPANTMIQL